MQLRSRTQLRHSITRRPSTAPVRRIARAAGLLLLIGLSGSLPGCVAPGADIHLAPFYSRTNTGDAGVETEALGGLWRHRRNAQDGALESLTVGPFFSLDPEEDGYLSRFLVPLGYKSRHGEETRTVFYPVFISGADPEDDGSTTWQLAALPGLLVETNTVSGTQFGAFPIIGKFDDFVTFDKLVFLLWPLFIYAERAERVSYHFLWPFLGWTYGGGERSFRVFPFYSRTEIEGRFDRRYYLWPFFHYQKNFLGGDGEEEETVWMFWPFYGHTERGSYTADTVLWPFFGYASNTETGGWSLDAPWPFVRFQRTAEVHRSRVWPFYGYLKADGLESTTFLWPIVHFRHEDSVASERKSTYVVPLWQAWDHFNKRTGVSSRWRKLFPFFQYEEEGDFERGSFPTLDPFWQNELIDRHYSWLWKLWEWQEEGELRRERAWLGLYKRERGLGEDRKSFAGLWSSRKFRDGKRRVKETSILFGLLRWRVTEDEGFDMLRPAFPGPGWPAQGSSTDGGERVSIQGDG